MSLISLKFSRDFGMIFKALYVAQVFFFFFFFFLQFPLGTGLHSSGNAAEAFHKSH